MKNIIRFIMLVTLTIPLSLNAQELTRDFSGIKKISLSTGSGDCILKKGSGNEVKVHLNHTYGSNYNPSIEQQGDQLIIKENMNGSYSGSAKWTLTIPNDVDVKLNSGSGDMEASGLKVTLKMNTGSGDLSLEGLTGNIDANTGSGDVALSNFSGEAKANTGSGNIKADQASGELQFNCGSGHIKLSNIEAGIRANVGSGDIDAVSVILKGKSSFNSGSGDVEVVLAASPAFDIAVGSGSGDAQLDFGGNKIAGEVIMKANKKNGDIKAPFKFDKEEEVEQGRNDVILRKTAIIGDSNTKIQISTGSGTASIK